LMHRCPWVTEWSDGDVTFTIRSSCVCSSRLHPTPQNEQMVVTTSWASSSQVPARRMSCSVLKARAPVGQTPMQLPH